MGARVYDRVLDEIQQGLVTECDCVSCHSIRNCIADVCDAHLTGIGVF